MVSNFNRKGTGNHFGGNERSKGCQGEIRDGDLVWAGFRII